MFDFPQVPLLLNTISLASPGEARCGVFIALCSRLPAHPVSLCRDSAGRPGFPLEPKESEATHLGAAAGETFHQLVHLFWVVIYLVCFGATAMPFRVYSWLCARVSFLEGLREPYGMPGIKPESAACKAITFPSVLSLLPQLQVVFEEPPCGEKVWNPEKQSPTWRSTVIRR